MGVTPIDYRRAALRWAIVQRLGPFILCRLNLCGEDHPQPTPIQGGTIVRPDTHPALEYHAPTEEQIKAIKTIRAALSEAMYAITDTVPQCAERTLALRHIEDAAIWSNKAIVFDGQRYL